MMLVGVLSFRAPMKQDLQAVELVESTLKEAMSCLLKADLIPVEMIPHDTQRGPDLNLYGLYSWQDLYTPRQLLTLSTFLDLVRRISPNIQCNSIPRANYGISIVACDDS